MKTFGNILGLSVSIIALLWLATKYDFSEMLPHLQAADYTGLMVAPVVLIANFMLRAARWRLLYSDTGSASLRNFFSAMMIGNLCNNILPARGGELVKIYLLGKTAALPKSRILASVIVEKSADLIIAIGLLGLLLVFYPVPEWARKAGIAISMVTLLSVIAIALAATGGMGVDRIVHAMLAKLPSGLGGRITTSAKQFRAGLSGPLSLQRVAQFICASAVIWCLEILLMKIIALAFSINAGPADLLFIMLMILFGTMVPSSPGYIGTFEFFGLSALAAIGISGGKALSFVVVLHAVLLLGSSLIGIACVAHQGWSRVTTSLAERTK